MSLGINCQWIFDTNWRWSGAGGVDGIVIPDWLLSIEGFMELFVVVSPWW